MNKKEYGENWEAIRNRILDRDKRICTKCLIPDRSWVEVIKPNVWQPIPNFGIQFFDDDNRHYLKVFLQVAHIDNDKTNMNPTNLISLCPLCHLAMDKDYKRFKRLSQK